MSAAVISLILPETSTYDLIQRLDAAHENCVVTCKGNSFRLTQQSENDLQRADELILEACRLLEAEGKRENPRFKQWCDETGN